MLSIPLYANFMVATDKVQIGLLTSAGWEVEPRNLEFFSPGDWTGPPDRIRSEEPGQDATKLWISRRAAKTLAGTSLDAL